MLIGRSTIRSLSRLSDQGWTDGRDVGGIADRSFCECAIVSLYVMHMACIVLGTPPLRGGANSAWLGGNRIFFRGSTPPSPYGVARLIPAIIYKHATVENGSTTTAGRVGNELRGENYSRSHRPHCDLWSWPLTSNLQSQACCGRDPYTCEMLRSKMERNGRMDGLTDGRTELIALPFMPIAVGSYKWVGE